MKKLMIAVVALLAVGGGWYYGSPLWTLKSMRDAAVAKDSKALSAYVDFKALRADVKTDLKAQIGEAKQDDSLGELGAMFANVISDKVIDGMITPEALTALFATTKGMRAVGAAKLADAEKASESPTYEVERGLSQFRVKFTGKDAGQMPAMMFARDGLSWKLSGVDFPPMKAAENQLF
jgi:Protein of unknown function (DUF2939)